jgi:hypothetical protein
MATIKAKSRGKKILTKKSTKKSSPKLIIRSAGEKFKAMSDRNKVLLESGGSSSSANQTATGATSSSSTVAFAKYKLFSMSEYSPFREPDTYPPNAQEVTQSCSSSTVAPTATVVAELFASPDPNPSNSRDDHERYKVQNNDKNQRGIVPIPK